MVKLLKQIYNKEQENILYEAWKGMYLFPYYSALMKQGSLEFVSFEEFRKSRLSQEYRYTNKTSEEVEEEITNVFRLKVKHGS